jgi:hypothetical protein
MTATTIRNLLEDLKTHEDADMPATIIFNDIAGDLYPDKSFDNLVEAIRAIDGCDELATAIAEYGIQFKMISEGDTHTTSGWVERNTIGCSTEEWYMESGSPVRKLWEAIVEDDDTAEEVRNAIASFETEICTEVITEAKKRYGSVPSNDEIGLLFYQDACKNAPTAFDITKDDSEYGDLYWGKINEKLTKLVFVCDDESRSEAWFNGLRPTANFVDGDRLHIEA